MEAAQCQQETQQELKSVRANSILTVMPGGCATAAGEESGGAYFHERVYWALRRWLKALAASAQRQREAWRQKQVKVKA